MTVTWNLRLNMVSKPSCQNEVPKHAYCNFGDLQTTFGCNQQ